MSPSSSRKPEQRLSPHGKGLRILVFTEGTLLVHSSGAGLPRSEIVKQAEAGNDPSLADFARYVAIGHAPQKLRAWRRAGATILYLTSRQTSSEVRMIRDVLRANHFPRGRLVFRRGGEGYGHVAERALADVIVEDDCESIGGEKEMTYPQIRKQLKPRIRSVVVEEFGGIDHLPDDPSLLHQGRGAHSRTDRRTLL